MALLVLLTARLLVVQRRHDAARATIEELRDQAAGLENSVRATGAKLAQYGEVIAEAGLGILLYDGSGRVLETNRAAAEFVGARHGAALAEARIHQLVGEAVAAAEPRTAELQVRTPHPRVLRVTTSPIDDGAVAYVEDVSERRQTDAARTDFVANVSHELKTPLGALVLLAETLQTTDDPDVRARLVGRVGEQANRMSRLVDDILDLSMVEASAIEPAIVDLDKVVAEAVAAVRDIAGAAGVEVNVVASGEDVRVRGDQRQLVSAVSNLLSNAIAYTAEAAPPHEVHVRVRRVGASAVIEVEDSGIGIAVPHQKRIFERFYRIDRARSRDTGGTGLGLAIVRHVAINHGGVVEVESESGVGSTFRIVIPSEEMS